MQANRNMGIPLVAVQRVLTPDSEGLVFERLPQVGFATTRQSSLFDRSLESYARGDQL